MGTKLFVVNDEQWDHVLNLLDGLKEALDDLTTVEIPTEKGTVDKKTGTGSRKPPKAKYLIRRGGDTYADAVAAEVGSKSFNSDQAWRKILPRLDTGDTEPVRSSMTRSLKSDPRFEQIRSQGKALRFRKRTEEEIQQALLLEEANE